MTKFSGIQYSSSYKDGFFNHYWNRARVNILLEEILGLQVKGVLLDVGCGRGNEVVAFREAGINAHGVELGAPRPVSQEIVEYLYFEKESLELDNDIREGVEVLTFLDVLEHIEDSKKFIEKHIHQFPNLKWIIVTVPARNEIYSNYDEYYGHKKRYCLEDLQSDFEGCSVQSLGYIFKLLYLPARIMAMLNISRKIEINPPKGNSWIHSFLSRYFILERKILPNKLWGTSILGVFKV